MCSLSLGHMYSIYMVMIVCVCVCVLCVVLCCPGSVQQKAAAHSI